MVAHDTTHWWFVARRKIIAELVNRSLGHNRTARILEVGAGTGSNLKLLSQFGRVDAIEPDDKARAYASERSKVAVRGGYLPDVPLDDAAYDLIVMLDVLEHIPDDKAALTALRPKLAPRGGLLITVPAVPWLWSDHDVLHHHQRRYTPRTLRRAVEETGYRVRYMTHFNTALFPAIAAVRALNKLRGAQGADDKMPAEFVNTLLEKIFASERLVLRYGSLPFGVSIGLIGEVV